MALVKLEVPPGVYANGTEYQSSGRWNDSSLVRWVNGTMRPVGGWLTRVQMGSEPLRGAVAWRTSGGGRRFAAGSASGLYASIASNIVSDITPADLAAGRVDSGKNTGWGGGTWGTGAWGVPRPDTGTTLPATTWSLDSWGDYLVACHTEDGRLLEWQLDSGADAVAISGAPIDCSGLFVTAERFLVALSPGSNYRRVQWSDREDNTVWTPTTENEAGDIDLQTSGEIKLGIRTRGQSLIITDQDAHSMTYQGPPFVYGFERVGSSCGAISRLCAAAVDAGVFWMGARGFYVYAGGAVTPLPCDVLDRVFDGMNSVQASKVAAVTNQKFSEIWWFYPSEGSTENDRYVTYNYKENHWALGVIDRTSGVDAGVFTTPIWFTPDGEGQNHEIGVATSKGTVFATSGPFEIGAGDNVASVTRLIPDELTRGDVQVTFSTQFYPNDTQRDYGPYSMAAPTDVRFTGRQIQMRVESNPAILTDWAWGIPRIEVMQRGRR